MTDWTEALCGQTNPEAFFTDDRTEARQAITICHECPIRQACLEDALNLPSREDRGIRAGMYARDRRKLRKERKAAAPSKEPQWTP